MNDEYAVVLFYRYVGIDDSAALRELVVSRCESRAILGRVLVASEGINGTLAATTKELLLTFIADMTQDSRFKDVDWKFSSGNGGKLPFNDLHVRVVKEIISTGEMRDFIAKHISFDPKSFGGISGTGTHLTAQQFHEAVKAVSLSPSSNSKAIVVDVRNDYEFDIGHFKGAKCLGTGTYAETWRALDDLVISEFGDVSSEEKDAKQVFMYCTGGIRCEKASAYLRAKGYSNVFQLQGGIHKYFEAFAGDKDCQFIGKEFVFDGRGAMMATGEEQIVAAAPHPSFDFLRITQENGTPVAAAAARTPPPSPSSSLVVGCCLDCDLPHDIFSGLIVCTVCRMPVLCCPSCVQANPWPGEYYCRRHRQLKGVYFSMLERFDLQRLREQEAALKAIEASLTRHGDKNKRRTLRRQRERVLEAISIALAGGKGKGKGKEEEGEIDGEAPTLLAAVRGEHFVFSVPVPDAIPVSESGLGLGLGTERERERERDLTKNPKLHIGKGFFWQA